MANTDQKILEVVLELKDKLSKPLTDAGKKGVTAAQKTAAAWKKTGSQMAGVGRKMTMGLTLPIVGVGAAIIKLGIDFQNSMNRVRALSGATAEEFAKLRKQSKMLGETTAFTAKQAADAQSFLAMAGFKAVDIIGALPGVLNAAAAGQIDLATTADIASNILTGFGLEATEMTRVADVMTNTFTSANVDLRMLGESMKFVGPIASSSGLVFEEVAAAVGLLGNAGIQGSMAGTSLKTAISLLINPGAKATASLKKLKVSIEGADGAMLPLVDIIAQFEEGLEGMGEVERTAELMTIFGQRAGPAMAALVNQGSAALERLSEANLASAGTAARIATEVTPVLTRLSSAVQGLGLSISDSGLLDGFVSLVEAAIPFVQNLAKTNPVLLNFGVIAAGVVASLGPLLMIIGNIVAAAPGIGVAFTAMTGPIGIAVAAIVAGGALIIANWGKIKSFADSNFPQIAQAMDVVKAAWLALTGQGPDKIQSGFIGPLSEAEVSAQVLAERIETVRAAWDALTGKAPADGFVGPLTEGEQKASAFAEKIQEVKDKISPTLTAIRDKAGEVFGWLGAEALELVQPIIDWWMKNWPLIKEAFSVTLDAIKIIWDKWGPPFMAAVSIVWESIKLVISTVWNAIKLVVKNALAIVGGIFEVGLKLITGDWSGAWQTIADTADTIAANTGEFISGFIDDITEWFENVNTDITEFWVGLWDGIWATVTEFVGKVVKEIETFAKNVVAPFQWAWDLIVGHSIWPDMWKGIYDTVDESVPRVLQRVTDLHTEMVSAFTAMQTASVASIMAVTDAIERSLIGSLATAKRTVNDALSLAADVAAQSGGSDSAGWIRNTPADIGGRALGAVAQQSHMGVGAAALGLEMRGIGIMAGGYDPTYGESNAACGPGG